jgi:hypothetical protein
VSGRKEKLEGIEWEKKRKEKSKTLYIINT